MSNSPQTASVSSISEDDDSEWENEYHDTETETFYITLDISSESSNINPTKKTKTANLPAKLTTEALNTVPQSPSNNGLWGRAQAVSRTKRASQSIRSMPGLQTRRAESTSAFTQRADNVILAVDTPSPKTNSISAVDSAEIGAVSARLSTSEINAAPSSSQSKTDVLAQPIVHKSTGSLPTLDEAGSDASNVVRSTNPTKDTGPSSLPYIPTMATPLPTSHPSVSTTTQAAEAIIPVEGSKKRKSNSPEPEERIQILDIHSSNPLISFQKQLYSCTWGSTIGTDLILTSPEPTSTHPLLKQTPSFGILAASGIKLIGRPARPVPKEEERSSHERLKAALSFRLPGTDNQHEEATNGSRPVTIPIDAGSSIGRQNQARFLERLIAIKAAKGEKDGVTVYAQKTFTGTGWRAKQRADREVGPSDLDMDSNDERDMLAMQVTARMPSGTTARKGIDRVSGKRRAHGGLFRDYKPKSWDDAGGGISRETLNKPQSWIEPPGRHEKFPSLANESLDAATHLQMMESVEPPSDIMITVPRSSVNAAENTIMFSVGALASFDVINPNPNAQHIASPTGETITGNEAAGTDDIEMKDVSPYN